ncbi:hypothetical protein pipiens_003931 [Culex pipiens pipiens]|uniref:Uncharacterized protein n=1 Tax=Culex pipiens pipiens TaxID=38569 RepID=A0ABD1CQG8_CULPP
MCDILVMNLNGNRKRLRSDDGEGGHLVLQRKMFINQQRMDQQDERKMKQIQDKTINMLFMGAKNNRQRPAVCQRECLRHVRLLGAGEYDFDVHSCPSWMEKKPDRKCRICDRQSAVHRVYELQSGAMRALWRQLPALPGEDLHELREYFQLSNLECSVL